jgi:hypothetical protein
MTLASSKVIWLLVALMCIAYFTWLQWEWADTEYGLSMGVILSILSFPLGPAAVYALSEAWYYWSRSYPPDWHRQYALTFTIVAGLVFLVAGYVQWFVLLPRLRQRIHKFTRKE